MDAVSIASQGSVVYSLEKNTGNGFVEVYSGSSLTFSDTFLLGRYTRYRYKAIASYGIETPYSEIVNIRVGGTIKFRQGAPIQNFSLDFAT